MPPPIHPTPIFSVELFPPKTPEGMDKLKREIATLNSVAPDYFSVTYGAGGSTREGTFETVTWLRGQGIETAPHLACIGSTRERGARDPRPLSASRAFGVWWRCVATCRPAWARATAAISAMPMNW